jgi:hypothetical protein
MLQHCPRVVQCVNRKLTTASVLRVLFLSALLLSRFHSVEMYVEQCMNIDLENICEEEFVAQSKHYPGMERLRKITLILVRLGRAPAGIRIMHEFRALPHLRNSSFARRQVWCYGRTVKSEMGESKLSASYLFPC